MRILEIIFARLVVDIQTSRRMLYVSFEFESKFGGSFLFFFFLKRDAQRGDEWLPPRATAFLLFTERLQKNVLASPSPDRRFLFFNFTDCKVRMDTQLSFFFFFSLPVVAIVNVSPFSFFLTLPFHQIRLHYL